MIIWAGLKCDAEKRCRPRYLIMVSEKLGKTASTTHTIKLIMIRFLSPEVSMTQTRLIYYQTCCKINKYRLINDGKRIIYQKNAFFERIYMKKVVGTYGKSYICHKLLRIINIIKF